MPATAHRHPPRRAASSGQAQTGQQQTPPTQTTPAAPSNAEQQAARTSEPVLKRGDSGEAVKRMQEKLGIEPTGIYGATTEKVVADFQRKHGLTVDGIFGGECWSTLKNPNSALGTPLGQFDAYRQGAHLGKVEVLKVDGVRMTPPTARAWKRMKAAAAADGVNLTLNSGFRTMGEQQSLYRSYQNGTGNLAAYPGYSNHQNGVALDIDVVSDAAYDWMHANGGRFGFKRTVPSEAWHWEYLP